MAAIRGRGSILSVVITTRNRRDNLRHCLESLQHCAVPAGWTTEILVVDNGGTDDIRGLVASMTAGEKEIEFRYLSEPRQGKSFAVNCGVTAAKGKILAFTDDDVIADHKWLTEIIHEFDRDPGLGLLAGRVELAKAKKPSVAVTRVLQRASLNNLPSLEGFVLGCNLAIRPAVLDKVKGRDTRLGPGRGLSCEDIDFTYRVLRSGFRGMFSPEVVVYHDPGERDRTREYLRGWGAFYFKFLVEGDPQVARQAWWKLRRILGEFVFGGNDSYSALKQIWQMAVGATIMATRMVISKLI